MGLFGSGRRRQALQVTGYPQKSFDHCCRDRHLCRCYQSDLFLRSHSNLGRLEINESRCYEAELRQSCSDFTSECLILYSLRPSSMLSYCLDKGRLQMAAHPLSETALCN